MKPNVVGRAMFNRSAIALVSAVAMAAAAGNARADLCAPSPPVEDPWPKAGETRRHEETTAFCSHTTVSRAFVAAPGGFAYDELLGARDTVRRHAKTEQEPRIYRFFGKHNGFVYGYSIERSGGGDINAWPTRPADKEHGSDLLFPVLASAADDWRWIACSRKRASCALNIQSRSTQPVHGESHNNKVRPLRVRPAGILTKA